MCSYDYIGSSVNSGMSKFDLERCRISRILEPTMHTHHDEICLCTSVFHRAFEASYILHSCYHRADLCTIIIVGSIGCSEEGNFYTIFFDNFHSPCLVRVFACSYLFDMYFSQQCLCCFESLLPLIECVIIREVDDSKIHLRKCTDEVRKSIKN